MSGSSSLTSRWALALLLVLHAALGVAFNLITPVWEAPDEVGHYLYVRYLQAYRALPVQGPIFDAPRAHHPPGYYFLGALLTAGVNIPEPPDTVSFEVNTKFPFRFGEPGVDNKMAYIHLRPEERWPYSGQALAVHLIRLLSTLFSTLAVGLAYFTALQLRPQNPAFALLAAGFLAFNPALLFIAGVINNDTAGVATVAAVLYLISRFGPTGYTPQRWLLLGTVWGLGLLLKTSAVLLGLPIALAVGYEALRTRRWQVLVQGAVCVGGATFAIAGWWYIRNHLLYGDWTANKAILDFIGGVAPEERFTLLPQRLHSFALGLLGKFGVGHGSILYPEYFYIGAGLLALLGLGHAAWLGARGVALHPRAKLLQWVLTWPNALWLIHLALIGAVCASVFSFMLTINGGWIGRYLFPAFISLGCVLAAGFLGWVQNARWHGVVAWGFNGLQIALASYAAFGLMLPAYSPPPTPTAAELQRMTPVDANIEGAARVLGYTIDPPVVRPGGVVTVTVYWEVTARTELPYTVFIHVLDPTYGSLAQRDTYPGLGNYPTQFWEVGRTFVDTYRLYLPAEVPSTENATIVLGLYNWRDMIRLPVTGANAVPPEERWVQFGQVVIQP